MRMRDTGAKTCILFIQCQRPLMAHADEAVERVGDPKGPSLGLRLDPVLGLGGTLPLGYVLGRINLVQPHELDEAKAASRTDPAPLMIGPHEVVNEQQHPRLHVLNVGKLSVAVLGLQFLEHSPRALVYRISDMIQLRR